jgi:4-hydroxybenzoate polyprenyltransferase
MPNKFLSSLQLARLHVPASFLLPFFIASLGAVLGCNVVDDLKILPLFFFGSITARGAGCIINDIFDREFDSKVERTKNRPLASGALSLRFALVQLFIFLLISLLIVLTLPKAAIYTAIVALFTMGLYPLMKRFINLPQVFLGFTYSMASLIGYASITGDISISAILLYLAIASWTIGFDIIYGYMDISDDKKINVKSMSIWLENKNYKMWIMSLYIIFIILLCSSYYLSSDRLSAIFALSVLSSLSLLMWQTITLDVKNPANCLVRFRSNMYIGAILVGGAIHTKIFLH